MILTQPAVITARLLPGIKVGDTTISIAYASASGHRMRYAYHIDNPEWEHSAEDLSSGCNHSLQSGLASLLSFLTAAAEAYAYTLRTGRESDNADLFPPHVTEWAYQNSDELSMLQCELQDNPELIVE